MKIKILISIVLIAVLGFAGYKVNNILNEDYTKEEIQPVSVEVVTIKKVPVVKDKKYQGIVGPVSIEKVSFKSSGRLEHLNGDVGDLIASDFLLVSLDKSDMIMALDAANNQLYAANADYSRALKGASSEDVQLAAIQVGKAQEAVNYLMEQVAKVESLFSEGIATQSEVDSINLELELANKDLELANTYLEKASNGTEEEILQAAAAQVALAKTNRDSKQALIDDADYITSNEFVIMQNLYEEGELVAAGYPVVILRSVEKHVTIGVSGKELDQIKLNQEVILQADNSSTGIVTRIGEIPDESHFLYEVEISVKDDDFRIGELVECTFMFEVVSSVVIPISSIMNDGMDYVFVHENGVATIQKIEIQDVIEGDALVTGLLVGQELIVTNINRIQEQSKVLVKESAYD